jgi:hypothetical protein
MSKAAGFIFKLNEFEKKDKELSAILKTIDDFEKLGAKDINAAKRTAILHQRFPDLDKAKVTKLNQMVRQKAVDKEVGDVPVGDLDVFMGQGNKKLADHIKTFNLPAERSCPDSESCSKDCYAKKSETRFRDVSSSRTRNFRLARESREDLKKKIQAHLKAGDIVRIHESGDVFSQAYLDMWNEIVAANPSVFFYTYTKTEGRFDWSAIKKHKNFNLVSSKIDDERNFGPEEEIKVKASELNLPICPCKKGNDVQCGVDCKMCMTKGTDKVLFIQH